MKANETPEERRARRLAKKQMKRANSAIQNKGGEVFGYSDEQNPFGDTNLTKAFVWKKKYEKMVEDGYDPNKITKKDLRLKQLELQQEIEKVRMRRKQREEEQEAMDMMRDQMAREAEMEQNADWEEREEQFHREQAKLRSEIRIQEGREKPIDLLAKNLFLSKDTLDVDAHAAMELDVELAEPYTIFQGLRRKELEDLMSDIEEHVQLKTDPEYWGALMIVGKDELLRVSDEQRRKGLNRYGLHKEVQQEVDGMLSGKSKRELTSLEEEINYKMEKANKGESRAAMDVTYWEALLAQLKVFKAKAFLREFHEALLRKRLKQLKEQTYAAGGEGGGPEAGGSSQGDKFQEPELIPYEQFKGKLTGSAKAEAEAEAEWEAEATAEENEGLYSPELMREADVEALDTLLTPEQDLSELWKARRAVLEQKQELEGRAKDEEKQVPMPEEKVQGMERFMMAQSDQALYEREKAKGLEDDEVQFSAEVDAPDQEYWWHDKYRPRKPRYFNRVKTGYEWNKYNQTHYDKENPPPKIVQGYKFNIFYPDLINPQQSPRYILKTDPENPDYQYIRFSAGPPYEDIMFKIVNKEWEYSHKRGFKCEWEYSHKRGFKCVFDKGVLHLYFNFRRYFYRR
eukprot:g71867.t1